MSKYKKNEFSTRLRKNRLLPRKRSFMLKDLSYDHERDQIRIVDNFGQIVLLSSEQALVLLKWLSQLFSHCQGCDQRVSLECLQALTYLREVAPFRVQTAWLCPDCYAGLLAASVRPSVQE